MKTRKTHLGNFIADLFHKYQTIQQSSLNQAPYRLIDIKENKQGKCILTVQVIGKSSTFKTTPEKILADDNLVKLFSSIDIRTITYYACQTINRPKNQILCKRFCDKVNSIVFGLKNIEKNTTTEITAAEISLNKKMIAQLSPEDAHMVGYVASQDVHNHEKEAFQKLRNSQKEIS